MYIGPFGGQAFVELSDPFEIDTQMTIAQIPIRTSLNAPWMTFNILNKCGISNSDTSEPEWSIAIHRSIECSFTFDITKKVESVTTIMATMLIENLFGGEFNSATIPIQKSNFRFTKEAEQISDEVKGGDSAIAIEYSFNDPTVYNTEIGDVARMLLTNRKPTVIPTWVSLFAAGAYQSNLVYYSQTTYFTGGGKNNQYVTRPQIPYSCGGPYSLATRPDVKPKHFGAQGRDANGLYN